jgi:hypothetical protein
VEEQQTHRSKHRMACARARADRPAEPDREQTRLEQQRVPLVAEEDLADREQRQVERPESGGRQPREQPEEERDRERDARGATASSAASSARSQKTVGISRQAAGPKWRRAASSRPAAGRRPRVPTSPRAWTPNDRNAAA